MNTERSCIRLRGTAGKGPPYAEAVTPLATAFKNALVERPGLKKWLTLRWLQVSRSLRYATLLIALAILLNGCLAPERTIVRDRPVVAGDVARGRQAIRQYGCISCHVVPGVLGANSHVGPPLTAWASRHYIAGKLPNEPEYLVQWIRFPQAIEPGTAMPDMNVTEQAARDISAYLYTLEEEQGWWSR